MPRKHLAPWVRGMIDLSKDIEEIFGDFGLPRWVLDKDFDFRRPLSDLKETDLELIASMEMPGIEKEDIELKVTEDYMEVKAEKKQEKKEEEKGYFRTERSYRGFYTSVPLPKKVLTDQVTASYENGILKVTMPKAEEKEEKKINIE